MLFVQLVSLPALGVGGQVIGPQGSQDGNAYLNWAISKAAVYAARFHPRLGRYLHRLASKYEPAKAKCSLAHKLWRAVYDLHRKGAGFNADKFLRGQASGAG